MIGRKQSYGTDKSRKSELFNFKMDTPPQFLEWFLFIIQKFFERQMVNTHKTENLPTKEIHYQARKRNLSKTQYFAIEANFRFH